MYTKRIFTCLLLVLSLQASVSAIGKTDRKSDIHPNIQLLRQHVEALASLRPPRSFRNVSSLDKAGEYIEKRFKDYGAVVTRQSFQVRRNNYFNVIASFGPLGGKRIVIGAHYDVCGEQPGADDNATGVATILEVARLLHHLKPRLKYRIDLVAFTLEEPPHFRTSNMGSAWHARSLAEKKVQLKFMLSIDMIGYFKKPRATILVGRPRQRRLVDRIAATMNPVMNIDLKQLVAPLSQPGIDYSDHLNYWNQGYRAAMLTNYFVSPNPHYHSPGDTVEHLDFKGIAEIVKGVYRLATRY